MKFTYHLSNLHYIWSIFFFKRNNVVRKENANIALLGLQQFLGLQLPYWVWVGHLFYCLVILIRFCTYFLYFMMHTTWIRLYYHVQHVCVKFEYKPIWVHLSSFKTVFALVSHHTLHIWVSYTASQQICNSGHLRVKHHKQLQIGMLEEAAILWTKGWVKFWTRIICVNSVIVLSLYVFN